MARARGLAPVALIALLLAPAVSGLAAPRPTLPRARPRDNVLPPLLRLRGGDSGALQKAQSMYFGVPLLTRSWLSAIVAIAGLNQVGILPPELLQIDATAVVKRWQFWRPFTAASFMGGLGPQLLQKCYYLVMFGKDLERTLGVAEYTRVLASCTALLCLVCAMLGWQFVGDGLIQAITVIMCQQHPDQPVSLYGLSIPCQYLPFAQLCMSYLFTQQIPWNDILGAVVGYVHYYFNDNTKPDSVFYKHERAAAAAVASSKGGKKLGSGGSAKKGGGGGGGGGGPRKKGKAKIATYANMKSCGDGG